jgi:hypothetical protein
MPLPDGPEGEVVLCLGLLLKNAEIEKPLLAATGIDTCELPVEMALLDVDAVTPCWAAAACAMLPWLPWCVSVAKMLSENEKDPR